LPEQAAIGFGTFQTGVREELDQYLAFVEGLAEAPHWPREAWKSFVLPDDTGDAVQRRIFLARFGGGKQGSIAGIIAVALTGATTELELLLVASGARRQGLGGRLSRHWLQWACESGATEAFLEVRASNTGARSLYGRLGFQDRGVRARYYHQPKEDAVLMQRTLPRSTST